MMPICIVAFDNQSSILMLREVVCDMASDEYPLLYKGNNSIGKGSSMSDQSNQSEIESNILEFIKSKHFSVTDNFPRCVSREKEIIMENKASALIDSILGTEKFVNLMNVKCERNRVGDIYTLKAPIKIPMNYFFKDFTLFFDKIAICEDDNRIILNITDFQRDCKVKCAKSYTGYGIMGQCPEHYGSPNMTEEEKREIAVYLEQNKFDLINLENKELYKNSLFECCQMIGACDTPEEVLLSFDCDPSAYGKFKLGSDHSLRKSGSFTNDDSDCKPAELKELINSLPHESEESTVQQFLYRFVTGNQPQFVLNKFFEKNYSGRFKHVYSFKDESGHINQKVIKLFDFHKQEKLLIPCTTWVKDFKPKIVCVPLPKGQILYNLDLFINPDIKAVILTDSIEIADQNQINNQQIVWTSFLPELSSLDWSPLKELEKRQVPIYYLITNHSGRSLADAYVEAEKLSSYLRDQQQLELKYIQVAVDYHEELRKIIWNLSDITTAKNTPEVVKRDGSVKIILHEEFNKYYEKSQTRIPEFWEKQDQKPETPVEEHPEDVDASHEATDYILRPIIKSKSLVMIYAEPGFGKSKFTLSLCASIISKNKIFKHRWWNPMHVPNEKYVRKILYIDYRYDEATQKKLKRDFVIPYLSDDVSDKQQALANLIIVDGKTLNADPENISNHQKFLDLLEKAKDQGTKGHPVDLIVFDSFNGMVKDLELSTSWSNIMPLFDQIKKTGAAVLLTHHSDAKGNIEGFKAKKANCDVIINFALPDGAQKASTLNEPRLLKFIKFTENSIPTDKEEFQIKFDFDADLTNCDGKKAQVRKQCWQSVGADEVYAKKEFLHLLEVYNGQDYTPDAAANMLGMSRSQMFKLKKIYEEELGKAQK